MYRIFIIRLETIRLGKNPLTMGKWFTFEGEPEYSTDDLDNALTVLKNVFADKISKENNGEYIKCYLPYLIDDNYNIIATLDFDKTILMNDNYRS
jgi:hypothetical protein